MRFLNLGPQPLSNNFRSIVVERPYNLNVCFDIESKLVSLETQPDMSAMFNKNYPYRSSCSQSSVHHFRKIAQQIQDFHPVNKTKLLLEIGSNDGVFLINFPPDSAIGIEPCYNMMEETSKMGYKTYGDFLSDHLVTQIKKDLTPNKTIQTIYSANCMCHIEDINSAFRCVSNLLNDNGVFIFEDPYLLDVLENNSFDQFYDEHAHIFSLTALLPLLEKNNLHLYRVERLRTHGGSIRIYCEKEAFNGSRKKFKYYSVSETLQLEDEKRISEYSTYLNFANKVKKNITNLTNTIKELSKSSLVIGYGATSKSTVIYNACGLNRDYIRCVVDTTPEKQGKLMPGTDIPVVAPTDSILNEANYAFLGAWNYKDEILAKESHRKLKFITHVPEVMVL